MAKKKIPKKLTEIPVKKKYTKVMPIIDPEEAIILEDVSDIIPEENPFENPEPYDLPEPGEGP
jgi:hypothetical protein